MFTCANSNILIIPRKHTHCVFKNNQKKRKIESIEGDLEGTGNVSVWLQQSHELLFSSHLPHQLDAHDQQHPLWMEKQKQTKPPQVLLGCTIKLSSRRVGGRAGDLKFAKNPPRTLRCQTGWPWPARTPAWVPRRRSSGRAAARRKTTAITRRLIRGTCSSWSQVRNCATLWQCLKVLPGCESMVSSAALRLIDNYRRKLFLFYVLFFKL